MEKKYEYLTLQTPDNYPHVALITINRPQALNALSSAVMQEVLSVLLYLDTHPDIRISVLTGSKRAFSAGADISEMQSLTAVDQLQKKLFQAWDQLDLIKKPWIAVVDGYCLGGGFELAMSADMIFASQEAVFGQPEIKIGTMPGAGGTQRLTRAIGKSRAMYYILSGETFSASEAFDFGLVAQIMSSEVLLSTSLQMASKMAQHSQVALNLAKNSINQGFEMTLKTGLQNERHNFFLTFASEDQKEGMRAFIEKRAPQFKDR